MVHTRIGFAEHDLAGFLLEFCGAGYICVEVGGVLRMLQIGFWGCVFQKSFQKSAPVWSKAGWSELISVHQIERRDS